MKDNTASQTARSVAAHRLEYARVVADYGDPAADQSLTADVADGLPPNHDRMHEYLRWRTAFFDAMVVDSIAAGLRQVVIGGAGYDGRALRYAKPGVRWFEVDHRATRADKLERLARLAIDTRHIRFIPADFTTDPIAEPLIAAGLDAAHPALFLLEGVAVYLDPSVVGRVLTEFRAVAAVGDPLAISVSIASTTEQARARFRDRVAAFGEPTRSEFDYHQARDLLAATGWELRDGSERQRSLGLLLARATGTGAGGVAPETAQETAQETASESDLMRKVWG
jgi:methyltransferase (TIGR00027 family)